MQPLLVLIENLHWIDAGTQAVLDSLIESLPLRRLILLVSYRPEYQHGWGSKTYYTSLRLHPLLPEAAEALLDGLLGQADGAAASASTCSSIAAKGTPSFSKRVSARSWRRRSWTASGAPTAWPNPWQAFRCQPRCKRSWRPGSIGCRRKRSSSSRALRSLAGRSRSPSCKR